MILGHFRESMDVLNQIVPQYDNYYKDYNTKVEMQGNTIIFWYDDPKAKKHWLFEVKHIFMKSGFRHIKWSITDGSREFTTSGECQQKFKLGQNEVYY